MSECVLSGSALSRGIGPRKLAGPVLRANGNPPVHERDPVGRFRGIYEANYAQLLGYALRRCERSDDAADVVAETFLAAWRRLDDVPFGDEARLWLYGIARGVLRNHRRGVARRHRLGERLRGELSASGREAGLDDDPQLALVSAAFEELRPDDRELLGLATWEGLSSAELSRVLGCSINASRIRLHRARKRLEGALARKAADAKRSSQSGHVEPGRATAAPRLEEER